MKERKVYTLKEIAESIQRAVNKWYDHSYWVRTEMAKLNLYHHSGHCYPELVEKEGNRIVAQMKATLWRDDYERINSIFLEVTKEPLKDGISILLSARVRFHPVHGLALEIQDIDPAFTLGELARKKQETITRLKKEEIFDRNRSLKIPLLPQRIAVISVETSKGYADFLNEINKNPWGYRFFHMLFPSLLQGDEAVDRLIGQLNRIRKVTSHFDVVAIVRGGGGDVGLSCYDSYRMAREVALFPIPVLTGIGHSTNETVVQMVAFRNSITPTALAQFLIQKFHDYSMPLEENQRIIKQMGLDILRSHRIDLQNQARLFRSVAANSLGASFSHLQRLVTESVYRFRDLIRFRKEALVSAANDLGKDPFDMLDDKKLSVSVIAASLGKIARHNLQLANNNMTGAENQVRTMDPENVLKRGYSITRHKGTSIRSAENLKSGDQLITEFYKGKAISIVELKEDKK